MDRALLMLVCFVFLSSVSWGAFAGGDIWIGIAAGVVALLAAICCAFRVLQAIYGWPE